MIPYHKVSRFKNKYIFKKDDLKKNQLKHAIYLLQ